MKHSGPKQQQQRRGAKTSRQGPGAGRNVARPAADRSMLGRKYETGAALRSAGGAEQSAHASSPGSELERVAGSLCEQHGERLLAGSHRSGVPVEATAAIVLTETSQLRGMADDRVAVRFEPYEFFRRTGRWLVATHRDQDAEYQVLAQAKAIDADAAHESTRMGVAQISGQEAAAAGHQSAQAMFTAMQDGEAAQIDGLLGVIANHDGLRDAMAGQDWRTVAQLRAGPGYGALGYDDALAAYADAYRRAATGFGGGDDDDSEKPKKPRKPRR